MTMPRGVSRALYAGNGQAVDFPFFFKVWEEDQLSVLVTSPDGATTEATGWTAALDESGGTLTYLHNGAPLPGGWKLAIMRDMPFVQEVDLITGTRFDPEVIETALDVATAERQQLLERLDRAVVVEPTDEGGPSALLADIRDARASSAASAASAQASANAASNSAQSAAGSAAVATEQREAACICAGEAQAARDVAIAQTEAANTLMEAELAKVNAIVAANKTDQQAAVTAARQWAEKEADLPVDYDEDGNPRYSARHWAESAQKIAIEPPTAERRGAIRVGDGLHLETGENGETDVLAVSAAELGGRLQFNDELWLTESGSFVPEVTGWYQVLMIDGGDGAGVDSGLISPGKSGNYTWGFARLAAGESYAAVIGSAGLGAIGTSACAGWANSIRKGGATSFAPGVFEPATPENLMAAGRTTCFHVGPLMGAAGDYLRSPGAGFGGGQPIGAANGCNATFFGGGGAAYHGLGGTFYAGNGGPGAIRLRFHNPARADGPAPAPALFAARRMAAPRAAAAPVTVNLYDPATGQGSVWRVEDAEARLAEGLITQEAWQAICAERAAAERASWVADPDTVAERFSLLRAARDARLAATDYLVAPDYPLTDEERTAVTACRQALRDLPAQEGAPWDGGGEATPWPAMPHATQAAGALPCA